MWKGPVVLRGVGCDDSRHYCHHQGCWGHVGGGDAGRGQVLQWGQGVVLWVWWQHDDVLPCSFPPPPTRTRLYHPTFVHTTLCTCSYPPMLVQTLPAFVPCARLYPLDCTSSPLNAHFSCHCLSIPLIPKSYSKIALWLLVQKNYVQGIPVNRRDWRWSMARNIWQTAASNGISSGEDWWQKI